MTVLVRSYNSSSMHLTPAEAHKLLGTDGLPVPVSEMFRLLEYSLEPKRDLRRPAVSWPDQQVARFRPGREEAVREALAHELGHVCNSHSGSGRFCGARAWASPDWNEREAHSWAEEFLMPLRLLKPYIIDLGSGMRLSRVAALCRVDPSFARRRLRHADLDGLIWDDTVPGAYRSSA
jgi:hypothetical protein